MIVVLSRPGVAASQDGHHMVIDARMIWHLSRQSGVLQAEEHFSAVISTVVVMIRWEGSRYGALG